MRGHQHHQPPLKTRNESKFETALRLTRAVKDSEGEIIGRKSLDGEYYLDSKGVLDAIYDALNEREEGGAYVDPFPETPRVFPPTNTIFVPYPTDPKDDPSGVPSGWLYSLFRTH